MGAKRQDMERNLIYPPYLVNRSRPGAYRAGDREPRHPLALGDPGSFRAVCVVARTKRLAILEGSAHGVIVGKPLKTKEKPFVFEGVKYV